MVEELKDHKRKLKRIFIEVKLPKGLEPLNKLAQNIWWTWNHDAIELFKSIDEGRWEECNHNAVAILEGLSYDKAKKLESNKTFMARLKKVEKAFDTYMAKKPAKGSPKISYFCMEYGLHISLRLYSGGLGILAGDYMKEASDSNADMLGVGLLYRYGYFEQGLSMHGDQIAEYKVQKFTQLPVKPVRDDKGEWLKVSIQFPGRLVFAKVWKLNVGRIKLYLLDTDVDENSWEDRSITHQLYGGDNEHRLKQEMILGIGGVRALKAMNVESDIFHCNEGHAAFLGLERLKNHIKEGGMDYEEALEVVRSSSLFTTHTPVPAGHDHFHESMLRSYIHDFTYELGISWDQLMSMGKVNREDMNEEFSMSYLATRMSQEVNGVSKLHGTVSQKMFNVLYPGYSSEELYINYVTNSVHYPTWIANEWHDLYTKTFGKNFLEDQSNKDYWRKIQKVPSKKIVEIRTGLKKKLIDCVKEKIETDMTRRGENPRIIFEALKNVKEDALIIGFARRFATYKRAHLLFKNLDRLAEIVNATDKPVMFLFAGKAHPADRGGQDLIKNIINISKQPRFAGKVVFLENYNMEIAKLMVQGVDVWLNTPTRPKEASGTSGMKAAMNGVMNFSVLDGWWAEGYRPDAGWALSEKRTYMNQELQNELDAENIYNTFETEIIPMYYDKNKQGISEKWVGYIKNIIAEVAPQFTMKRMMDDYFDRFYNELFDRTKKMRKQDFAMVKKVTDWKTHVKNQWKAIEVVNMEMYDTDNHALPLGDNFEANISLFMPGLSAKDIGVEVIFYKREESNELTMIHCEELEHKNTKGDVCTFVCKVKSTVAGVYEYGFRIFPKSNLLPHQQDFNLVKWI